MVLGAAEREDLSSVVLAEMSPYPMVLCAVHVCTMCENHICVCVTNLERVSGRDVPVGAANSLAPHAPS